MKLGGLFALLSFCGLFAGGMIVGLLIDLVPGIDADYEGLGSIVGAVFFLLVGPAMFICGFRKQAKKDKEKEMNNRKPENLRPMNLSGIVKPPGNSGGNFK